MKVSWSQNWERAVVSDLLYLTANRIIFPSEVTVNILLLPLAALWSSLCVWLCVALPAVEVVDIRQVSKQHISLVAKTCWQDRSKRRIVHFSPVALQNVVREIINKSTASTPHTVNWNSIFSATIRKMKVILPGAPPAAPPHRSSRFLSAPSSHVWSHTRSQGHQTRKSVI